jgi:autotransporter passenger strand-loop-strand repeat protein
MGINITAENSPHDVNGHTETGDFVFSGGVLSVTTLGTISDTTVLFGGKDIVGGVGQSFADSFFTDVFSGGSEVVTQGGTSFSTTLFFGGLQIVNSGGVASSTFIGSSGEQVVSGGIAVNTVVGFFGLQEVSSGGIAIDTTVSAGGFEDVDFGGTAIGTLVAGSGVLNVFSGGVTSGTTLIGSPGSIANEFVFGGGLAVNTTVEASAVLDVTGGAATGTIVDFGGIELVDDFGFSTSATILAGGQDLVFSGGATFFANVSGGSPLFPGPRGLQVVEGPATGFLLAGSAFATTVNGGVLIDFGFVSGTVINSGFEVVWSGGVSDNETINGIASFNFVVGSSFGDTLNGGTEFVLSGGFVEGTTVNAGGGEVISSGSEAEFDVINTGGNELVFSAGLDVSATVAGTQIVLSGGTASGADIISGGLELVESGGTTLGALIDGGLLEVQSGGSTGTAPVSFSTVNGGVLQLDASQSFTGLIAGFASPAGVNEAIDLRDISFGAGTKVTFTEAASNLSGTLTVTSGSETANLTLLGVYSTANFTLSSDGSGGTLVKDPGVTASASIAAPQHA